MRRGWFKSVIASSACLLNIIAIALTFVAGPAFAFDCQADPSPINPAVTITLDTATAWQPRGGQVRVKVESQTLSLENVSLTACIRWADIKDERFGGPLSVQLVEAKSITAPSSAVYAVTVPQSLERLGSSWFDRVYDSLRATSTIPGKFDAAHIVPIADLRFVVSGGGLTGPADVVNPVGITSV